MSASWCQGAKMVDFVSPSRTRGNRGKPTFWPRARLRKIFWYQDTGYPVHRCVCMSVYRCIYVSHRVPECILGVKIVIFWYPRDL